MCCVSRSVIKETGKASNVGDTVGNVVFRVDDVARQNLLCVEDKHIS